MGVQFRTKVDIDPSKFDINYQTPCLMVGSCFSDNIGEMLQSLKLPILQNPFGVLYNPSSIAQVLNVIINKTEIRKKDLIQHNKLWHSFLFHGSFSNESYEMLIKHSNTTINNTHVFLKNAKFLFITFGTAWVYQNKQSQLIVSNCHKIPSINFNRYRLNVSDIIEEWNVLIKKLQEFNPDLKIIFTVSPIRHLKDGAHENQLSKSTLFLSIDSLINEFENLSYFPSFEIIHDELRDYRFYQDDMIHISEKGKQYLFEKFEAIYFTNATKSIAKEINAITQAYKHRILNKNKSEIEKFAQSMIKKIELIEKNHPFVKLLLEKNYFENL